MKIIIILASILASQISIARNISYLPNSELPTELKSLVAAAIEKQCQRISYADEVATDSKEVRIDQGIVDTYYSTTFSGDWAFDGTHPVQTSITVESVDWSVSNPAVVKYEVLKVTDTSGACSK